MPPRNQLYIILAAVLWGTTGTAQAFAPAGAQPDTIGALRMAIGGGALLLVSLARGGFRNSRPWPVRATLLAGGSMAAYQPLFFAGVAATGVAVGTVVTIGSAPVLAGLLAVTVRGERPGRRWFGATALAIAGCALLLSERSALTVDFVGVVLALGAGLAYALYSVTGKRLLETQPPDIAMAPVFGLAALILAPALFRNNLQWLLLPSGLAAMLHLGLLATALAYLLFARGLQAVPVSHAVTLTLAEPLTAATLGLVVLGERLTAPALLGVALILSGLVLLSARRTPRHRGGQLG
ncbi:MAG: DMT family transporter [Anaerolineales bacterium]